MDRSISQETTTSKALRYSSPIYKFLNSKPATTLIILFELLICLAQGAQAIQEMGTDFGVYYLGATSIGPDYGLYSGFFDHKGPVYYLFLKHVGGLFEISIGGAFIAASATYVFWVLCIWVALGILQIKRGPASLLSLVSITLLLSQNSNATIALFQSGFVLLAIVAGYKYVITENWPWLAIALSASGMAALTRVDGAWVYLLVLFAVWKTRKSNTIIGLLKAFCGSSIFIILIFIYSEFSLNFDFFEFIENAIRFNLIDYAQLTRSGVGWGPINAVEIILFTGLPALLLLSFAPHLQKNKNLVQISFPMAISATSGLVFLVINSDKEYHALIFLAPIISAIFILTNDVDLSRLVGTGILLAAIVPPLYGVSLESATNMRCLISSSAPSCTYEKKEITVSLFEQFKDDNLTSEYLLNNAWPYILEGRKPTQNFTPEIPTLVEDTRFATAIFDSNKWEKVQRVVVRQELLDFIETYVPHSDLARFSYSPDQTGHFLVGVRNQE